MSEKKNDEACGDDVAARTERAKRIHEQIDALKNPAAAPRPAKSPRDFIADQMKGPRRTPKK